MFIKVRAEEVLIGAVLGAGLGLAMAAPLSAGMPALIPSATEGAWGVLQTLAALVLAGAGAAAGGWLASRQERDSHHRGAQYFPKFGEAQQRLQAIETRQFSAAQLAKQVRGLMIGGVELSRGTETGHLYTVGMPRSGKTVVVTSVCDALRTRGDRLLIFDPKGDFVERYFDPETCVLLGPWDERAAIWDAASDISSEPLANEFASALCGDSAAAGQNRSFHANAATIVGGLIKSHIKSHSSWSWSDLRDSLAGGVEKLVRDAARGDDAVKTAMASVFKGVEPSTGDLAVLSVLTSAARWLMAYAAVDAAQGSDRTRFSLRRWLTRQDHTNVQIVILNAHAMYQTACEALFGAMLTTVAGVAASPVLPEVSADDAGSVFMVCDECPQMGAVALEKIQVIAEVGRSRGFREILALQDESQLEAKVGREKAAPMLAVQSTKIYLRCSDRTAESVSKRLGEREILRIDTTAQDGAVAGKTKRAERQTVIQPSDLMGLHVRTGDEKPAGVELVMHAEDMLGRLVQPFPPRIASKAPRLIESNAWLFGSLPPSEKAASTAPQQPAAEAPQPADPAPSEALVVVEETTTEPATAEPDSTNEAIADDDDPDLF